MDNKRLKLGSLFDGSGGFPLAGVLHGIEPVWASEIEPFPIRVTKARFPNMKHLGSVTDVRGDQVEPVDIITFGSPCQDLSVAGKQLGIHDGERSNLFFEAIRIIKEMRDATADKFPRFAVWENVPGAFSSNKGKDFQAVLQAFCNIRGEGQDHIIPMPPKNKWLPFGTIVGDGWSVAWRVYDAQYWGVPQRRKRIYLIADFGSERAGEILSECESMCGYPAQSGEAREGTAADAERSAGRSDCAIGCDLYNGQLTGDKVATLGANSGASANHAGPSVCYKADGVKCLNPWDCQSKRQYSVDGVYRTLDAGNCAGGQAHGICYPAAFMGGQGAKARSIAYCDDGSTPTLKSTLSGGNTVPDVVYPINTMVASRGGKDDMRTCFGVGEYNDPQFTISAAHEHAVCYPNVARSLTARHDSSPCVDRGQNFICVQNTGRGWWNEGEVAETLRTPCGGDSTKANLVVTAIDCRNMKANEELSATIQAKNGGGHSLNYINPVCYRQDGFAGYSDGVGTLKASGGDMGGDRKHRR